MKRYHAPTPRSSRELARLSVEIWGISGRQHLEGAVRCPAHLVNRSALRAGHTEVDLRDICGRVVTFVNDFEGVAVDTDVEAFHKSAPA